jgi:amino acid transporter
MDTTYALVAGLAGGKVWFHVVNATLLIASLGSGFSSQLGAARILCGMGRDNSARNCLILEHFWHSWA